MSNRVILSPRDLSLLRLLSWTPATSMQILRASPSFEGEPLSNERRVRERLQSLQAAGVVRSWPANFGQGGLRNTYKLTPAGFQLLYGAERGLPGRAFFAETSPSLFEHTFRLAEIIVEVIRACHLKRVRIERFLRENELTFQVGQEHVQPDGFFRLNSAGKHFNLALELDNSTESLDSNATNSLRRKLSTYHAYQESVLAHWKTTDREAERPRFRVIFLTRSLERSYHILALAATSTRNPGRRLVYSATLESVLTEMEPLHAPIFLDHAGSWRSLVDLHPTAEYRKTPVRLSRASASPFDL